MSAISRYFCKGALVISQLTLLQSRFAAIGPGNSWEYIGRISPAIPTLRDVQDHVQYTINPYPRYKKHTSPDAEKDIKTLCVYYTTHRVHRAGQVRKASVADTPRDLVRRGAEESLLTKAIKRWVDKRSGERCTEQDYTIT